MPFVGNPVLWASAISGATLFPDPIDEIFNQFLIFDELSASTVDANILTPSKLFGDFGALSAEVDVVFAEE